MKFTAGLIILASYMPYMVWANASDYDSSSSAAAAASSSDTYYDSSSSAAAAASSSDTYYDSSSSAAAAASSSDTNYDSSSSATAAASSSDTYYGSSSAAAAVSATGTGAAATATSAASSGPERTIRCKCGADYKPVCGTDGHTYSNECMLRCVSDDNECKGLESISVHRYGQCQPISCKCSRIDQPVCSYSNRTYASECYLKCENSVRSSNGLSPIKIAYYDSCKNPTCVCPDSIIPVCGTDGKTYRNVCILDCYNRINQVHGRTAIKVKETGACKTETCICPGKKDQICASDETSYPNDCFFECQNRRRHQLGQIALTKQYKGECIDCGCTKEFSPVCAKDNINKDYDFSNYCEFCCFNRKREAACLPPLALRWNDRCDCSCSNEWKPVCTTDGKTYETIQNKCVLQCQNRKRVQDGQKELVFKNDGVCKQCDCQKRCGDKYKPVCGSDRRTYWNICWLDCNNDCYRSGKDPLRVIRYSKC